MTEQTDATSEARDDEPYYTCGHSYREPGCGWPCCGYPDRAAPDLRG